MTRKVTLLTLFLTFTLISGVAFADNTPAKIGVVDVEQAFSKTAAGKAAIKKLERATKKKKKEFKAKEAKAQRMQAELEKQAALMNEDAKRRKINDYRRLIAEIQEAAIAADRELMEKKNKLFEPVLKKLKKTIHAVAKQRGFSLVLNKGAAIYAIEAVDLTDAVIATYGK